MTQEPHARVSASSAASADTTATESEARKIEEVLQTKLFFMRTTEGFFSTWTTFSEASIPLTTLFDKENPKYIFIKLSKLLIDKGHLLKKFMKDKKTINEVAKKPWSPIVKLEDESTMDLAKLISPLCTRVFLEQKELFSERGFKTAAIGLGTFRTWHGWKNAK